MGNDALRKFRIPKEFEPKPLSGIVLLRSVDTSKGGEFGPPKDFKVVGGSKIIAPEVSQQQWCTNLCEVVGLGSKVEENPWWDEKNTIEIGQWVVHRGASPFFILGQEYLACTPEFIVVIVKERKRSKNKLYEIWDGQGVLHQNEADNVESIGKKKD